MTTTDHLETADAETTILDWTGPLTPSGNLRRRAAVSRAVQVGASGAAAIAVAMLGWVIYEVVRRGVGSLSFAFLTQNPVGLSGGGIANALLGTAVIILIAALFAIPVGVLTGIYLTEFAGPRSRSGAALKLALDLMQGLPTIVVGLFIYGLIVLPQHKQTGFAAAVALSIVMLPLIARSSQEVLLLVPGTLREAADALGVNRWRAIRGVILPTAAGGIATGAILAIARAAGETAPLLICNSLYNPQATQLDVFGHGVPSIPMYILFASDSSDPDAFKLAWAAALVLLVCILLANVGARVLLARSRTKRATG
jgi:phosphate transport system permease protein